MNSRNLKWLYRELPGLVAQSIISQQQSDQIKEYYGRIGAAGRKRVFLIVSGALGAFLIGLGVISLIAHNWEQFGRPLRAALSLAPVCCGIVLMGWALFKEGVSEGFREGAATFLTLMVGASISLISQTYHIPGDVRSFVLTWMLLAVPLVYLASVSLPAVIYVAGITFWGLGFVWQNSLQAMGYWPLMAVILPHFVFILKKENYAVRAALLSVFLAISFGLFNVILLSKLVPQLWVIYLPLVFAAMYLAGTHRFPVTNPHWQQPFRRIGEFGVATVALVLTYRWPWGDFDRWRPSSEDPFLTQAGYAHLAVFLVVLLLFLFAAIRQKRWEQVYVGVAPVVSALGFAFTPAAAVACNLYFLVVCLERLSRGIRENKLRVINAGMLLLILLIALRFFDSEIDMIVKGLVLIILGAGFLTANAVFVRRKGGAHA